MDNIFYYFVVRTWDKWNAVVNLILNGQYLLPELGARVERKFGSRKPYSKWTISSTIQMRLKK